MFEYIMANYNEIVDIDDSANALFFKTKQCKKITSIVKLNDKEIKQIKLKKEFILFFTSNPVIDTPLKAECTFKIYLKDNYVVEIIYESEDKQELLKLEEYVNSILI